MIFYSRYHSWYTWNMSGDSGLLHVAEETLYSIRIQSFSSKKSCFLGFWCYCCMPLACWSWYEWMDTSVIHIHHPIYITNRCSINRQLMQVRAARACFTLSCLLGRNFRNLADKGWRFFTIIHGLDIYVLIPDFTLRQVGWNLGLTRKYPTNDNPVGGDNGNSNWRSSSTIGIFW